MCRFKVVNDEAWAAISYRYYSVDNPPRILRWRIENYSFDAVQLRLCLLQKL